MSRGLIRVGAALLAQPLGMVVQQKYTTSGYPGNLEIKSVTVKPEAKIVTHRVETSQ